MVLCRPRQLAWPDRNGNVGGYFCPLVHNVPVRPVAGGSAVGILMLYFLIKKFAWQVGLLFRGI